MGIPGVLKEIGKGERVALVKLAIEHLERNKRPLRVAIDAAIWNFQNQASQGGKNPALRTLFFRLLKLLALPVYPVFVYDGKNKPLTKRGRTVSRYGTNIENEMAKQMLSYFRFPFHTAPGEAEAECAFLQQTGIVDAVMSQDVDAIMFGSTLTLRDWSKEGTRGNKTPTHVNVLDLAGIKRVSGLDPDGMILVAMLSGGDYDEAGVPGFGTALACEIARAGFGTDLLDLVRNRNEEGLCEWRERLEYELTTNESGYFKRRHPKLQIPLSFPNRTILGYYMNPATSTALETHDLEHVWLKQWSSEIDVVALRNYTADMLDWKWKSGARRFVRCFAQPFFQDRLGRGLINPIHHSMDVISESRRHFTADGIVELRFAAVPADVTGLDIEAEEDNPEYLAEPRMESDHDEEVEDPLEQTAELSTQPASPSKRKSQPWSPFVEEKWWIPQTLLRLGLPVAVDTWEQKQREILSDPKKFLTRKCVKPGKSMKVIDAKVQKGSMRAFLQQLPGEDMQDVVGRALPQKIVLESNTIGKPARMPRTPTKSRSVATKDKTSPSISSFFKKIKNDGDKGPGKEGAYKGLNEICASNGDSREHAPTSRGAEVFEFKRVDTTGEQMSDPFCEESKRSSPLATGTHATLRNRVTIDIVSDDKDDASSPIRSAQPSPNLSNVTQRSRRTRNAGVQNKTASRDNALVRQADSIESFFYFPAASALSEVQITRSIITPHEDAKLAACAEGPVAVPRSSKVHTLSRESLPGTWTQIEARVVNSERHARVSHVDLTND